MWDHFRRIAPLAAIVVLACENVHAEQWTPRTGERIAIVGNTLADRMQHDGWLEALLHARFPRHDLVIRNLGFSGDELTIRLRSAGFGSPDDWLTKVKADTVFAFFGYNESYGDVKGLERFKADLAQFIKDTKSKKYNGASEARLIVFSPTAFQNLRDRNLPDGQEHNRRLALYTAEMRDVARAQGVIFVDLFEPSRQAFEASPEPLTINGVHFNDAGQEKLARWIEQGLFNDSVSVSKEPFERLRTAVKDRNFHWFQRYRIVDGYSIYGGRADLRFVKGQSNRDVMNRELLVLEEMTTRRDQRIWSVAQGSDTVVNDETTSPFIPVTTNKPGPLPGGKHLFLEGNEAASAMKVANGMKVGLFASEKEFPELVNPVQMAWDNKGRLWVAVWPTYPHWRPKEPMNDKLLILEDTDGDGRADRCKTFADNLHCPTGFEFHDGGVLIAQAPELWYLKDTTGDDRADTRVRLLHGLDSADTHHTSNSFVLDPGGSLYFQEGTFHQTQVETPRTPPVRCANAGVFRYEPRTKQFDVYVSYGFANPHGHVFDPWGQDIVVDGTSSSPFHATLFSGRIEFPQKHPAPPMVYRPRTRPCPGMEFLYSRHFPDELQGNLLVGNVIGFQGILQYKLHDNGASFGAAEVEPIVSSTDPNFRPSDLKIAPDGSLYFIDWHNPIIGHMQHNLRDPSRDREHGRIFRITYPSRPLLKPPIIAGASIPDLLEALEVPEERTRYRARVELAHRPTDDVLAAAKEWAAVAPASLIPRRQLDVLWLRQSHNAPDQGLLDQCLGSSDFRVRAAATRVLCAWRDRVSDPLARLNQLAGDEHPRVRLEAIRAASFFTQPEALEVVLVAMDRPTDQYLDFVRAETLKTLEPVVRQAIASSKPIDFKTPAGARYFISQLRTDDLFKLPDSEGLFVEILSRPGVRDPQRIRAIEGLAKSRGKSNAAVIVQELARLDKASPASPDSVLFDLARLLTDQPAKELEALRPALVDLSKAAQRPLARQLALSAVIASGANVDGVWNEAAKTPSSLIDLLSAIPFLRDSQRRGELYPKVDSLLDQFPASWRLKPDSSAAPMARYVRVELPGRRRTLTLAEIEVMSGGLNIAPEGKPSQHSTAHGGDPQKAIDRNTDPSYGGGGQTHSAEGVNNPWWELDLGSERPIEAVVVHNRSDGALGNRLAGFSLLLLDKSRSIVWEKRKLPAPTPKLDVATADDVLPRLRRATLLALASVRGKEPNTFKRLTQALAHPNDRPLAISAWLSVPSSQWPSEQVRPALDLLMEIVRKTPAQERSTPSARDALQLAESLTSMIPSDEGRRLRRELGQLGVRLLRLGTVTDQMRFDRERLVIEAGKPFEILFENSDLMPHNVVLIQPGSLEEVGMLAESTATAPGVAERHYVPASGKVIASSKLLAPRESQRLAWTAPTKPGVYPYVCTYPGHWRRMYGALYVVGDFEAYEQDPEGYLSQSAWAPRDELLKNNRPRKEWTYQELAPALTSLTQGRTHAGGRQMFEVANCVACHKLGGVGNEIGPDLTKLDPKTTDADLLRSLIEPSHKIDDKYATVVLSLNSGQVVTGILVSETPNELRVIENPLLKTTTTVIPKSDIAERNRSTTSIMPKGMVDKLTQDEILDLLAYIRAGGSSSHSIYQSGHHH